MEAMPGFSLLLGNLRKVRLAQRKQEELGCPRPW